MIPTRAPRLEIACPRASSVSRTFGAPGRVAIGSSSTCDLRIVARGVRARHAVLEWDGRRLAVIETAGVVGILGRSVEAPFPIPRSTALEIGEAEVRVTVPEPEHDDLTLTSADDEPTLVVARPEREPRKLARACHSVARLGVVTLVALVAAVGLVLGAAAHSLWHAGPAPLPAGSHPLP
jgi:hypothetical protein